MLSFYFNFELLYKAFPIISQFLPQCVSYSNVYINSLAYFGNDAWISIENLVFLKSLDSLRHLNINTVHNVIVTINASSIQLSNYTKQLISKEYV